MATEARPVPRPRRTVGQGNGTNSDSAPIPQVIVVGDNEEDSLNGNDNKVSSMYENVVINSASEVDEVDQKNNNVDVKNPYSDILLQIGEIKLLQEKETVVDNKPKPAPRSRNKQLQQSLQYENTEIRSNDGDRVNNNSPPVVILSSATGAIKKQPNRTAPPRPPSPVLRDKTPELVKRNKKSKEMEAEEQFPSPVDKMTRSSSSNTLDSSQDGSEVSGSKFKTSSPGQVR